MRFPFEVSITRCRRFRARSPTSTLLLCGQRSNRPLSSFNDSVDGSYSPPGEILSGGSEEFGATQTVPVGGCAGVTEHIARATSRVMDFVTTYLSAIRATSLPQVRGCASDLSQQLSTRHTLEVWHRVICRNWMSVSFQFSSDYGKLLGCLLIDAQHPAVYD